MLRAELIRNPGRFRVRYRFLPSKRGVYAARAAEAAAKQDRFWDMHDALFEHGRKFDQREVTDIASLLGLNMKLFREDLESQSVKDKIARDIRKAQSLGVRGAPSFFARGKLYGGLPDPVQFKGIIAEVTSGKPSLSL